MNTKLQELTDKIYLEGVEKGNVAAEEIISEAKKQEQSILEEAEKKAQEIIKDAQKQSQTLLRNTEAELKLFSRQMIDSLKNEIADLLSGRIAANSVKTAATDKDFMQKIILTLVEQWGKNEQLLIKTDMANELTGYFERYANELLNNGITIEQVNNIETNFQVISTTGGYKIEIGESEFIAYFKEFLRPKLLEILF